MKCAGWNMVKFSGFATWRFSGTYIRGCVSRQGNAIIYVDDLFLSGYAKRSVWRMEKGGERVLNVEIRRDGGENRELRTGSDWNRIEVSVTRLKAKRSAKSKRPHLERSIYFFPPPLFLSLLQIRRIFFALNVFYFVKTETLFVTRTAISKCM